jgi:hypothetical protein
MLVPQVGSRGVVDARDTGGGTSLDRAFGIRLPVVIVPGTLITAAALLGLGVAGRCAGAPGRQEQAGAQSPAGQ